MTNILKLKLFLIVYGKILVAIMINDNKELKFHKKNELAVDYFYRLYIKSINNLLLYSPDKIENGLSFWSGFRKNLIHLKILIYMIKCQSNFNIVFVLFFPNV